LAVGDTELLEVSVVLTVFNEADNIARVLATLAAQTLPPTEVVIVDGGSRDATVAQIEHFKASHPDLLSINLLIEPGANISRGRNLAIAHASHELIAVTDAGVRLEPNWLATLLNPFKANQRSQDKAVQVVAGFFQADPDPTSVWEIALGATTLPLAHEIEPQKFLPSSRSVAFRRQAWQAAGGYPEWLDYCEDLIFDLNLKKQGFDFEWCPKAIAHFRPRPTWQAFFKQYYRYARGDGKADLFLKRHLLRYLTYLLFAPLAVWLTAKRFWLAPLFLAVGFGYIRTPYQRLLTGTPSFAQLSKSQKVLALLYVPLIRALGDVAKMCGYPSGVWWRWKQHRTKK
jgi:glycosyltransferase involved in cell wall biosynthesis